MMHENRNKFVNIRCTPSELLKIRKMATEAGMPISQFVRRRMFGLKIIPKTDLQMAAELRRLGGLLKQIYKAGGDPSDLYFQIKTLAQKIGG